MKRSEAAKYARWSAAAALLLASLTAGVYLQGKWVAHTERKKAPPPAPKDVTKLTNGITFSKVAGNQKIFTVEASKVTDFKDREASLLEEVKITIFGRTGERHDTIRTHSCQYEKVNGGILCNGEVQLDLESAADAERAARNPGTSAEQKVHVETRGVRFNRATGMAETDQPVKFNFPNGNGNAVGVEYHSEEGLVRLLRDVRLSLKPPGNGVAGKNRLKMNTQEPVTVTGKSLDFGRDSRTMHLYGSVEAQTHAARLLAGELILTLDPAFHAEKIVASAGTSGNRPEIQFQGTDGQTNLSAVTLTGRFASQGWVTSIEGTGGVHGSRRNGKEEDELSAENASLALQPKVSQPEALHLTGNVLVKTHIDKGGESRMLETGALLIEFAAGKKGEGSRPKRAETLAPGSIEWTDAAAQSASPETPASGTAQTKLQADKLELAFGPAGKASQLVATGNVTAAREAPGKLTQTATARSGVAQMLASGGWSQMNLQGDVKLQEGERSGQADHAVFIRATETALLTGKALARDHASETQAPRITFVQTTGEIRAEGGVRSTDFSAKGSGVQLAAVPANISSDKMQANAKTGRALYSGHARLWQGDSVLEADSIELLRDSRVLNAAGNVRAVFPQTAAQSPSRAAALAPAPKKPKLWHITAGTLTYRDAESRAHLEKNVVAQSADQIMRAEAVDLYFARSERPGSNDANSAAPAAASTGAQQINRAAGTGAVTVEQGARRATADRGEYTAADGKFVMSGGNPTIYDASEGTTTGRQLTFFLADDTIIVDSENGSRTLTKHRVEK